MPSDVMEVLEAGAVAEDSTMVPTEGDPFAPDTGGKGSSSLAEDSTMVPTEGDPFDSGTDPGGSGGTAIVTG